MNRSFVFLSLMSLLLLSLNPTASAQVQQPACKDATICNGSCPATYFCTPRVTSNCVYMISTGSGDWQPAGLQCGVCSKTVFGVPVTHGPCGASCVDACKLAVE